MIDRVARRRERRAAEERAIAEGRIPPGQSLTAKWPVLQAGPIPVVDRTTWRLRLEGLVDRPTDLTWDDFTRLPRIGSHSDIHCVTHWTKINNEWEGVSARDIVALAQPRPEARYVMVHAPEYSANLPVEALMDDDVLFATSHDGEELTPEHGAPVRLVVPKRYFWKSVKWVTGLEFMPEDRPGYWELRGYHIDGDPWLEQRFSR